MRRSAYRTGRSLKKDAYAVGRYAKSTGKKILRDGKKFAIDQAKQIGTDIAAAGVSEIAGPEAGIALEMAVQGGYQGFGSYSKKRTGAGTVARRSSGGIDQGLDNFLVRGGIRSHARSLKACNVNKLGAAHCLSDAFVAKDSFDGRIKAPSLTDPLVVDVKHDVSVRGAARSDIIRARNADIVHKRAMQMQARRNQLKSFKILSQ